MTVHRHGRGVEQTRQAATLELALALFEAIFSQDNRARVDDNHARIAVDDDPVVLPNQAAGHARTNHGGDVHAARHNRGVGSFTAHVGDKTGKHTLLELQHVGRRQIVRNQYQRHVNGVVQQ